MDVSVSQSVMYLSGFLGGVEEESAPVQAECTEYVKYAIQLRQTANGASCARAQLLRT
jgi:hypothetical protein